MTKREAAIVSAYTGFLVGNFAEVQAYGDEKFGRPTWTHEYGSKAFADELHKLAKADFIAIKVIDED